MPRHPEYRLVPMVSPSNPSEESQLDQSSLGIQEETREKEKPPLPLASPLETGPQGSDQKAPAENRSLKRPQAHANSSNKSQQALRSTASLALQGGQERVFSKPTGLALEKPLCRAPQDSPNRMVRSQKKVALKEDRKSSCVPTGEMPTRSKVSHCMPSRNVSPHLVERDLGAREARGTATATAETTTATTAAAATATEATTTTTTAAEAAAATTTATATAAAEATTAAAVVLGTLASEVEADGTGEAAVANGSTALGLKGRLGVINGSKGDVTEALQVARVTAKMLAKVMMRGEGWGKHTGR